MVRSRSLFVVEEMICMRGLEGREWAEGSSARATASC